MKNHNVQWYYFKDKDGPCLQKKGLCGPDYLPCDGEYQKDLCNGNPQRQCCVPKTEVLIPKPGIKNGNHYHITILITFPLIVIYDSTNAEGLQLIL